MISKSKTVNKKLPRLKKSLRGLTYVIILTILLIIIQIITFYSIHIKKPDDLKDEIPMELEL